MLLVRGTPFRVYFSSVCKILVNKNLLKGKHLLCCRYFTTLFLKLTRNRRKSKWHEIYYSKLCDCKHEKRNK